MFLAYTLKAILLYICSNKEKERMLSKLQQFFHIRGARMKLQEDPNHHSLGATAASSSDNHRGWHFTTFLKRNKSQPMPNNGASDAALLWKPRWFSLCTGKTSVQENGRPTTTNLEGSSGSSQILSQECAVSSSQNTCTAKQNDTPKRCPLPANEESLGTAKGVSPGSIESTHPVDIQCVQDGLHRFQQHDQEVQKNNILLKAEQEGPLWKDGGIRTQDHLVLVKESRSSSKEDDSFHSSSTYGSKADDISLHEKPRHIILNHMNNSEKNVQDQNEDIRFLSSISAYCMTTEKNCTEKWDLPYSKAQLTWAIVEVMEKLPAHSVPSSVLSCAMVATYHLSKFKPPLDPELESCALRWALHGVITMDVAHDDANSQAVYRTSSETLEIMLRSLLAENPTTLHLLRILEHINFWIHSRNATERVRATRNSASLLRHAILMPEFDNTREVPQLGRHVAELSICISDPKKLISHQAREGIYRLYELLLHQKGMSMTNARELWCREYQHENKMLSYVNTLRVGEVFGQIFSVKQRRTFLKTALLAIYNPFLRISEAGVLLVYSLLGNGDQLMGKEAMEVKQKIWLQLHKIRVCGDLPIAMQSLCAFKGDVLVEDLEETEH